MKKIKINKKKINMEVKKLKVQLAKAKKSVAAAEKKVKSFAKKNPQKALAIAAGIGAVLGAAAASLRRRK